MNLGPVHVEFKQRRRSLRLKEALLASFTEPGPSVRLRMKDFSRHDWARAKSWLDLSGLALYFLDRLIELEIQDCIPNSFLQQLYNNLADNRNRTAWLSEETTIVDERLRNLGIEFAFLKGLTLPRESVPERALRDQTDIDILIREQDACAVEACLAQLGYKLDAKSGFTWEFKAGRSGTFTLKHSYNIPAERSIDVQLLPNRDARLIPDNLARAECRSSHSQQIASLSSADIFVQQGQHIFKHLCSEFIRASWVLEYWRHACARRDDRAFWREVEEIAAGENGATIAIGAATLFASLIFGPFAPEELSSWSMEKLPAAICLWIQLYGQHVLLSNPPRSKLYLLLRKQLPSYSSGDKNECRRLLFPFRLPQRITRPQKSEGPSMRLRRYTAQALFTIYRLHFHVAEGVRLAFESPRWERRLADVSPTKTGYAAAIKTRLPLMAVAVLTICMHGRGLSAQTTTTPLPGSSADTSATASTSTGGETNTPDFSAQVSLSASQLISIVQDRPEILIELKGLMAAMPSNGVAPVQPDSISDEMLYREITTSRDFRQTVTIFLRTRGYLGDRDLQSLQGARASDNSGLM